MPCTEIGVIADLEDIENEKLFPVINHFGKSLGQYIYETPLEETTKVLFSDLNSAQH